MTNVMDSAPIRVNAWAPPLPVAVLPMAPAAIGVATKAELNVKTAPALLFAVFGLLPAVFVSRERTRSLASKLQNRAVAARAAVEVDAESALRANRRKIGAVVGTANGLTLLDRSGQRALETIAGASVRSLHLHRRDSDAIFATITIELADSTLKLLAPNNAETDLALQAIGRKFGATPIIKANTHVPGMLGMLPVMVLWMIAMIALIAGLGAIVNEGFSSGIIAVLLGVAFGFAAHQLRAYMIRWLNRPGRSS
jgi:hypothetical protein